MQVPFVDLAAQQAALAPELDTVIRRMFTSTDWILGDEVRAFEREFARYCDAAHAVGTDSGLSALELTLRAVGIGPGDEVITAANTFIATALAISHTGATPALVDVDPETANLDPAQVERALTPRTRAIIPVHLYGQPAEMDAIRRIASDREVYVIEDACQAHGARYRGRRVGSLGDAAAFSFYPAKNLGAFGDAGAVVTNDAAIAEAVEKLRDYGQSRKNEHVVKGFNHRLDTLQAALLRVKLRHLDAWNERRRWHAARYAELLAGTELALPRPPAHVEPVWHLYVVCTAHRDAVRSELAQRGIQTGIHYPVPIHLQPAYRDLELPAGSFPVSERLASRALSLPMYPELAPEGIERVATTLRQVLAADPAAQSTR